MFLEKPGNTLNSTLSATAALFAGRLVETTVLEGSQDKNQINERESDREIEREVDDITALMVVCYYNQILVTCLPTT